MYTDSKFLKSDSLEVCSQGKVFRDHITTACSEIGKLYHVCVWVDLSAAIPGFLSKVII